MKDKQKLAMLDYIREGKKRLQDTKSFFEDVTARSLYVVLLTAEGALMFGDLDELAAHCVEFANRKSRELESISGGVDSNSHA